jgi:hypothetical protein
MGKDRRLKRKIGDALGAKKMSCATMSKAAERLRKMRLRAKSSLG